MEIEQPFTKPPHRSFRLTSDSRPFAGRRIARGAIIIYFVTFIAGGFAACSCPGFFVIMAICAVISMLYGTRFQRILSALLLVAAIAGFGIELREVLNEKQRFREKVRRVEDAPHQGRESQ
jgi:purine-cytosine permease-like protein